MEFKSLKRRADVQGIKEYFEANYPNENRFDWESRGEIEVEYSCNISTASWGISSITCSVTGIKGAVELWKGSEHEPDFHEIVIPINNLDNWKILDDIKPSADGELLSVTQVIVDIHKREIAIS